MKREQHTELEGTEIQILIKSVNRHIFKRGMIVTFVTFASVIGRIKKRLKMDKKKSLPKRAYNLKEQLSMWSSHGKNTKINISINGFTKKTQKNQNITSLNLKYLTMPSWKKVMAKQQ